MGMSATSTPTFTAAANVTASRVLGTVYTNTTGKPLFVEITMGTNSGDVVTQFAGGAIHQSWNCLGGNQSFVFMVAPGKTYQVVASGGESILYWFETS